MMQKIRNAILLLLPFTFYLLPSAEAQDIHFSQFYETSILRNPALTGIFTPDYKVAAFYRTQWSTVSEPFQTAMINAEGRFSTGKNTDDYISVGLLGYYDRAGKASLQTTGIYPAINFSKSLSSNRNAFLSLGFTAGYVQRSYDPGQLSFDNEYQGGTYVPGAGAGEDLPATTAHHLDAGAGISLNGELGAENKTAYFVGVAAYHFTKPNRAFYVAGEQGIALPTRWNTNLGLSTRMGLDWELQAHLNYALQGPYNEIVGGATLSWINKDGYDVEGFRIGVGCFYRVADAVIPTFKIGYRGLTFTGAYDMNVSTLKKASLMQGGYEFSAIFTGYNPIRVSQAIHCPRF